ncbi:GNAT family N-acetyltransferase [Alkalicoccobacillus plakortidis]|uniref:GNAT family N-acetyltransferase n=1 Tax=Alkalicoccobacillus plakortidis TaxID=444060 RepID=A0ABT0XF33_9BACI|nr:GNAT family protein [Alkalicoccobacillus plakortidis]MCM2674492.1 GNAT family N-acetyltransferase [Alkalicoccobacillus plakortidis]
MNITPMMDVRQSYEMINIFQRMDKSNQGNRFSIFESDQSKSIGSCGFNYIDSENDRGEIGYELSVDHWGKGYMTEALTELVRYGFDYYKLNRIEAKVETQNQASQFLLKKLGFKQEGLLRSYEKSKGRYIDLAMFSVLKED